jgi:K319-like protein
MVKLFFYGDYYALINSTGQHNVNKSIILLHNDRTVTLSLFLFLFVILAFILLYSGVFDRKNAIPITKSHSAFVDEVAVNDHTSNNTHIQLPRLSPVINTHPGKTTLPLQQPSTSNSSNQVPLRISNNYKHNHHYTKTLTNSTQNVNSSPILFPQPSSVTHAANNNPIMISKSPLPPVNSTNNIQNNTCANNNLAIIVHDTQHSKMTTITANSSIVHNAIVSKAPITNADLSEVDYATSKISMQSQQPSSRVHSNLGSVSVAVGITANAGLDQKVKEGKKVILDGTASSSANQKDSIKLNFSWKQIAGKSVKLSHFNTAKAKFKAPYVKKTTKLTFKLTVDDGKGNSNSDTISIIVKPHKHKHKLSHEH